MLPQIVALVIVEKSFNAQLPTSYMGNSITPVFCTTFEINQRASSYSLVEFQSTEQMIHYVSFAPVGRKSIEDVALLLLVKIKIHFKYRGKFICCFFFKINFIAASCDCAKVKDITTLLANPVQRP